MGTFPAANELAPTSPWTGRVNVNTTDEGCLHRGRRVSHADDDRPDMGVRVLVRVLVCRLACVHGNCAPAAQVVASR